jgi:hypothetical protein
MKAEVEYDFVNSLRIIKGIGKNGKPYEMLTVGRRDRFNSILIALAKKAGVVEVDVTPKTTD